MKFTYLCVVIVISCSVCASGDSEIFPGLKFNFDEDHRSRARRFDQPNFYSKFLYPFQSLSAPDYETLETGEYPRYETIPDRADKIRQYKEVTDWDKYASRQHNKHTHHRGKLPPPYDVSNFDLNVPLIEDAWKYSKLSKQNDRYAFEDSQDGDDGKLMTYEQADHLEYPKTDGKLIFDRLPQYTDEENSHHGTHHSDDRNKSEQFASGRFKDVKVVEDPADFAYAPPDPRFYRKIDESGVTDAPDAPEDKNGKKVETSSTTNDGLKMVQRSEQNFVESEIANTGNADFRTTQRKSEGIEMVAVQPSVLDSDSAGVYVIAIVAGISAAATVGLIAVGIGWYNLQKHVKNASDVDYPAYGVTGPNKDCSPSGDRRLAQSAQMYHYQHQKQQIIAMERAPPNERNGSLSDAESDEENEEGDYTVYECPGLAPTGEMEVKNPLFQDDPTPAHTPAIKSNGEEK